MEKVASNLSILYCKRRKKIGRKDISKLYNGSLAKRFNCDQYGKSFRTRQGLSRHVQSRHKDKHTTCLDLAVLDAGHLVLMKAEYEEFGLSDSKLKVILDGILLVECDKGLL